MSKYRVVLFFGILVLLAFPTVSVKAFHENVYSPRVPDAILETLQDMDNPFSSTLGNIEEGSKIYFGKGLCVKCHGVKGKGINKEWVGAQIKNRLSGGWRFLLRRNHKDSARSRR